MKKPGTYMIYHNNHYILPSVIKLYMKQKMTTEEMKMEHVKKDCKNCNKEFDAKVDKFIRLDTKELQINIGEFCKGRCAVEYGVRNYGWDKKLLNEDG